ncbi:MAG TPA: hypothetical protein VJR89_14745 [Polyangiales bacterium]|nr:hypothetical protein [Polyangiales bacterium]
MLGLIYGVSSYIAFLVVFVYFAFFSAGLLVPRSVDIGPAADLGTALLIDLVWIALFGLQHSLMARPEFKRRLTRSIPAHLERATFVLATSLVLIGLMWQWRPLPRILWNVDNEVVAIALWTLNALGWLGVPLSSFMIDHFDLFGLKQAVHGFRRTSYERTGFVTPMFYRYVRHPIMLSLFVGFWFTPYMTVGHLVLALGMSIYILIGVHFEERALLRELGSAYLHYQHTTPKFLPLGARNGQIEDGRPSSVGHSQ